MTSFRFLGLVLLIVTSPALVACDREPPPAEVVRPIRTIRVAESTMLDGRKVPGRAKATQEVDLSFRVEGTLASLPVQIGDRVETDQVVAQLDPRDFEVAIKDAEARVALSRADLALAEEEFQRATRAFERDAMTELELTRSRESRNAASAAVDSAEATLDAANDALTYATLRAPFTGDITTKYAENFEDVKARDPVVRILDDSRIEMVVFVPEHLISLAQNPADISCEFDAFPGLVLEATIKEIGTEADPITRTYPVTIIMEQPDEARILPGMTGNAWATPHAAPTGDEVGYEIPISAIGESADGTRFVWVVDEANGTVSRRTVEVGEMILGGVRVLGLQRDELIATAGVAFLTEGERVRLLDDADARGDA